MGNGIGCRKVSLRQGQHAALALHHLHEDASNIKFCHALFQRVNVVRRYMDKAGGQRLEQLMKVLLSRSCQGCQRTAMEAVHQGHDGVAVRSLFLRGILPGHLDGALVGLRAGIGEEHLLHPGLLAQ